MLGMFTEFRDFLLHGNLVELAVAVVIGTAFATLVSTFTSGLITRLIAALGKAPDFSALSFTINESKSATERSSTRSSRSPSQRVVFFFVVKPLNTLTARRKARRRRGKRRGSARVHQRDPGAGAALRILHHGGRAGGRAGS